MAGIFISYRRGDTDIAAGRLADDLAATFGRNLVFRDVDTLEAGEDYVTALEHALDSCAVVLAIIGPRWTAVSEENPVSRLANPTDWVRLEISRGLKRGIRVIPVLVSATFPKETELPEDLIPLLRRQAFEITDRHWSREVELLAEIIRKVPGHVEPTVAPKIDTAVTGRRRKVRRYLFAGAAVLTVAALIAILENQFIKRPPVYAGAKAFIISSSQDESTAKRLKLDLENLQHSLVSDNLDQRTSEPLSAPIRSTIENGRYAIVLWSKAASESLYVRAELLASYELKKLVVPCLLDNTSVPAFLRGLAPCDLRRENEQNEYQKGFAQLLDSMVRAAPMPPVAFSRTPSALRDSVISSIANTQNRVVGLIGATPPASPSPLQSVSESEIAQALKHWPDDPDILELAGYNAKNGYMVKHWNEIRAGKSPADELLKDAAIYFYQSLDFRPDAPSALNGLGSVLMLRRDLNAAEFFVRSAIERLKAEGQTYKEAEGDLKQILQLKGNVEQPWNR